MLSEFDPCSDVASAAANTLHADVAVNAGISEFQANGAFREKSLKEAWQSNRLLVAALD